MSSAVGWSKLKNLASVSQGLSEVWSEFHSGKLRERNVRIVLADDPKLVLEVLSSGERESFEVSDIEVSEGPGVLTMTLQLQDGSKMTLRER
jgi:hypothetical protein